MAAERKRERKRERKKERLRGGVDTTGPTFNPEGKRYTIRALLRIRIIADGC